MIKLFGKITVWWIGMVVQLDLPIWKSNLHSVSFFRLVYIINDSLVNHQWSYYKLIDDIKVRSPCTYICLRPWAHWWATDMINKHLSRKCISPLFNQKRVYVTWNEESCLWTESDFPIVKYDIIYDIVNDIEIWDSMRCPLRWR